MSSTPCRDRVFPLKMAAQYTERYASTAHWLRYLLERLGREHALAVWQHAFREDGDALLDEILSAEWGPANDETNVEAEVDGTLGRLFPVCVEGVSKEDARTLIDSSWPFLHIRRRFSALNVMRQLSAYEALHLFRGGLALLAESLIELQGKQGELIAYDAMRYRLAADPRPQMSPTQFLSLFISRGDESTLHSAGLAYELVRASDVEVVIHIAECEWARYYQEQHPRVGYLMACSMDEADYRAVHPRIRMQRTSTIMEGAARCDFRIYALPEGNGPASASRDVQTCDA